jgi:hypothetical protein
MKKFLLGAIASIGLAGAANAAISITFEPGLPSPSGGFVVIDTFDNLDNVIVNGNPARVKIKTPPSDSEGAPPAFSDPAGTPYLSILGGGSATINFASNVKGFQFDWGSIDTYNALTVVTTSGSFNVIPGTSFPTQANGNQFLPGTNGLFTVNRTSGTDRFVSITLTSAQNSFEIDNLAVSYVPEPATWAMLIIGFGLVGATVRRRRGIAATAA